jgi:hypothetical protein
LDDIGDEEGKPPKGNTGKKPVKGWLYIPDDYNKFEIPNPGKYQR